MRAWCCGRCGKPGAVARFKTAEEYSEGSQREAARCCLCTQCGAVAPLGATVCPECAAKWQRALDAEKSKVWQGMHCAVCEGEGDVRCPTCDEPNALTCTACDGTGHQKEPA